MTSNNHRTVLVSANLGCAHDYDPKTFPLARMKKKNTLTAGRLCISASLNEILAAREMIQNPQEFESIFGDVNRECNEMTELGARLAQQRNKWNLRRWLEHRRDIKKFSETSYDLYILTARKSAIVRQQQPRSVPSEDIIPVTMDEVSPTEPVDGMLVTVDDDVDIDQAEHDITETMNSLASTYELQGDRDVDCSETLSIAPSELSYLTARTSCETDQPNPPLTSPPPTGPPPTDSPSDPTATRSPRADSPPLVLNFQNNTFVCTNLLLHVLNGLRLNSGNGSNFSDHNSGSSNMETFPQEFVPPRTDVHGHSS